MVSGVTLAPSSSSAAISAARRKSSRMKAGLVPSVAATTGSQSATSSGSPSPYRASRRRRAWASGSGSSTARSIRPGREASAGSRSLARLVVRTKIRSASSSRPSIALSSSKRNGVGLEVGAVARDQVDVLQHDHRGLERARERAGRRDGGERLAREEHDGPLGHQPGQVHDRHRLAGARRAVEEQAALDVAARGPQAVAVLGEPRGVALDALERDVRQDDLARARSAAAPGP